MHQIRCFVCLFILQPATGQLFSIFLFLSLCESTTGDNQLNNSNHSSIYISVFCTIRNIAEDELQEKEVGISI